MSLFRPVRTGILCILFAGAISFFAHRTYEVWSTPVGGQGTGSVHPGPAPQVASRVPHRRIPPRSAYELVAQKDLFSSDRREAVPEIRAPTPRAVTPVRPLDARFALFGILIGDHERMALVSNLDPKAAALGEHIWVRVGDETGTLAISAIEPGYIKVMDGASEHLVRLSQDKYQKQRPASMKTRKPRGAIEIKRSGTTAKQPR